MIEEVRRDRNIVVLYCPVKRSPAGCNAADECQLLGEHEEQPSRTAIDLIHPHSSFDQYPDALCVPKRDAENKGGISLVVVRLEVHPFPRRVVRQVQVRRLFLIESFSQCVCVVEGRRTEREASLGRGVLGCTERRVDGQGEEPFKGVGISG